MSGRIIDDMHKFKSKNQEPRKPSPVLGSEFFKPPPQLICYSNWSWLEPRSPHRHVEEISASLRPGAKWKFHLINNSNRLWDLYSIWCWKVRGIPFPKEIYTSITGWQLALCNYCSMQIKTWLMEWLVRFWLGTNHPFGAYRTSNNLQILDIFERMDGRWWGRVSRLSSMSSR